jgi:hypothetical protein
MFELGIFCVILLAAGYWAALWFMGRHDDVLHGKFVHHEEGLEAAIGQTPTAARAAPPFPRRPQLPVRAVKPARSEAKRVDSAALQSLLVAIQQDLKDVA